jgi:hypothetical protein
MFGLCSFLGLELLELTFATHFVFSLSFSHTCGFDPVCKLLVVVPFFDAQTIWEGIIHCGSPLVTTHHSLDCVLLIISLKNIQQIIYQQKQLLHVITREDLLNLLSSKHEFTYCYIF